MAIQFRKHSSIKIEATQLIINDIQKMLEDFGNNKVSRKILQELEAYCNKEFDIQLIRIWMIILGQYVPKERYRVYYDTQIFNIVPKEHRNKVLDRVKEIKYKLENGDNINAEQNKILPTLKYPHIDLLREQSGVMHFHLSLNNKRTNFVILANINIYGEKSVTFEKIITHQQMREDYLNLEYKHRKLVPVSDIKGSGIVSKGEEYNLRKRGIQSARGGADEQACFFMTSELHTTFLTIYMNRNLNNYYCARDIFYDFKHNLNDYYYNHDKLFSKIRN